MNPWLSDTDKYDQGKRLLLFDRAVGILKETNEPPTAAVELSKEEAFGMAVA